MKSNESTRHFTPSVASHASAPLSWDRRHGSQVVAMLDRFDTLFSDPLLAPTDEPSTFTSAGDELARLRALCVHDLETGTYNRRFFEAMAESEWVRALRHRYALSVLIIESTQVEATQAGSRVDAVPAMHRIAARAQFNLRAGGDLLARYDRARFAILLPETDAAGARQMAERLCRAVESPDAADLPSLGVRVGAATLKETCAGEKGWRGALDVAEQALKRARQTHEAVVLIEVASPSWQPG